MKILWVLTFLVGFFSCAFLFYVFSLAGVSISGFAVRGVDEGILSAPSDWVSEEDIVVLGDRVILRVSNATLSSYEDSGSMLPFFDKGANGIRVRPSDEGEVGVGDIVSFRVDGRLVVHRVVEKGVDENGVYFITSGDNSLTFEKVRFGEIEWVTIGVIY